MTDDHGLRRWVDSGTFQRGSDYTRLNKVRDLDVPKASGVNLTELTAVVLGSGGDRYRTIVLYQLGPSGRLTLFEGRCSCPVGGDCKHAVAVFLTAANLRVADHGPAFSFDGQVHVGSLTVGSPSPALPTGTRSFGSAATSSPHQTTPRPPVPMAWEQSLRDLLGGVEHQSGGAAPPLGLAFELTEPRPGSAQPGQSSRFVGPANFGSPPVAGRLRIRPMRPGKQGAWVRTGISWSELSYGYASQNYRTDHVRVLSAIDSALNISSRPYYSREAWYSLESSTNPVVWDLLEEARDSGIGLVVDGREQTRVSIGTQPVAVAVHARRDSEGVIIESTVGDQAWDPARGLFLGLPAHGIATWVDGPAGRHLELHRLRRRADPELQRFLAGGPIRVPPAGEQIFLQEYLPKLREHHHLTSPDASFEVPTKAPPVLSLSIEPMDGHRLQIGWDWIYRLGETERRMSLWPSVQDIGRRDPAGESHLTTLVQQLVGAGSELLPHTLPAMATTSGSTTIEFVSTLLPRLQAIPGLEVTVGGELPDYQHIEEPPTILVSSTPSAEGGHDWFDLTVTITVGGRDLEFEPVFRALATEQDVMILPDGSYFSLEVPALQQLRALIEEARALADKPDDPLRIGRFQLGWWEELESLGIADQQSRVWVQRAKAWRNTERAESELPTGLTATLRPYQAAGFQWLSLLREHGLGGVLADDMGLGKTLQALTMIGRARLDDPAAPPFLVVAPTSVLANWESEAHRFVPDLKVAVITATQARRGLALKEAIEGADLVITSYTLFRLEIEEYELLAFDGLILDEAQAVKNYQSKAFHCVKKLPVAFKLAITGTPMENNLMELWSLFSIVAPGLFPSPVRFTDSYRTPIERNGDGERLARLRNRIRPLMLRRTKEQVVKDLPPKQEQVLELELEPGHRKVYQRHLQRERQKVLGLLDDMEKNRFAIFRSLMLLRQASIDPFLIDPAYANIGSTKLNVLMELLTDIVAEGHRVLIFSQFTSFLQRVKERLLGADIDFEYLDGRTRNRPAVLNRFKTGTAPVFLISLKAGGVGLNLAEADYCILLDPWWNPASEAQAVDRAHRIGQTRTVMVYRLVARDTIEEKVMALKESKAKLFSSVMTEDGVGSKAITANDIRELLA